MASRTAQNEARLQKISPCIRAKVAAVLRDLESHGYRPVIHSDVFRTPAKQMELYKKGHTKVKWSFHNATTPSGQADALAADIIDFDKGWDAPKSFWMALASSAAAHGLKWGGYWGLSKKQREALSIAIQGRRFDSPVSLGWDTAHIEVSGLSLTAARLGIRPK